MAGTTSNLPLRTVTAVASQPHWLRLTARGAASLALAGLFFSLLSVQLAEVDVAAVARVLAAVSIWQWGAAAALTGISFWAVGHTDAVLHRHFATGLPDALTRRAGICAIAVSQTLGLGLITGAIVRWRMLPGQSLTLAATITVAVAGSFLASWAVVTAIVLLLVPAGPYKAVALGVLLVAAALCVTAVIAPRWGFRWPNGFVLCRLLTLCAIDTLAAAAAFHVLCLAAVDLPFATMLPVFLLALGAGLVSGTPGGLGAFEVTVLALLPDADPAPVLAAILAWRLTYYAVPALLAAAVVIKGPRPPTSAVPVMTRLTTAQAGAELGLRAQGTLTLQIAGLGEWLVGRTGHFLIALFDPSDGASFAALTKVAQAEGRLPVLYKCSARLAARAREAGFAPILIAREARICPILYRLDSACRAGLRRKLRQASAAGVTVTQSDLLPWAQLDRIAAEWATTHGQERGFSMGRYSRDYLSRQRVYIAWHAGEPLAFASFHQAAHEWTLDLMRHGTNLPNGTMHSLVQAAIDDAGRAGLSRLSLAAVPEPAFCQSRQGRRSLLRALTPAKGAGLLQFKSAFAPRWQRLYLVAPNRFWLPFAIAAVAHAVFHPPPIEQDHADNEFASAPHPWHRQG